MTWKDRYRAALVEVDPVALLSLIHDTGVAINTRSESLPEVTPQELQEMSDANCTLRILKSNLQAARS